MTNALIPCASIVATMFASCRRLPCRSWVRASWRSLPATSSVSLYMLRLRRNWFTFDAASSMPRPQPVYVNWSRRHHEVLTQHLATYRKAEALDNISGEEARRLSVEWA